MCRCAARPRSRAPAERRRTRPLRRWGRRVPSRPRLQPRRRRWALSPLCIAPLSLAVAVPAAQAAAFLPGAEADPPTGTVLRNEASAAEPLQGGGIRWTLAPWRSQGLLALDQRGLRLDGGSRARQSLLMGELDLASHIWQPWFVQLRVGMGFISSQAQDNTPGVASGGSGNTLTDRKSVV